jgi:putative transcriptional regulator
MNKTNTTVRIVNRDGVLFRVMPDGSEVRMPDPGPLAPMSEQEILAAALSDPDAQPMTDADFARVKMVPRVKTLRRALGLTQEEFAIRYQIPIGTLRDWEQGRSAPDQPARAYLKAIAHEPDRIAKALQKPPA